MAIGASTQVGSSRMEELTKGRRAGFRGLLGANSFLLFTTTTVIIGSFLYGTDQGVLSNLLTGQNFGSKFPDVYTDATLKGWVVAILQLGAWLGALINGPLADKISRKYSITVAAFVSLILNDPDWLANVCKAIHCRKCSLRWRTERCLSFCWAHYRGYCCRTSVPRCTIVFGRNLTVRVSWSPRVLSTGRHQ